MQVGEVRDRQFSYSAASGVFPVKIFLNQRLVYSITQKGQILPVHIQLNPTNLCNLKCSFCSCAKRNKRHYLDIQRVEKLMRMFRGLGAESVTVTGGGEPLMHPDINRMLVGIATQGYETGLVTNGTLLRRLEAESLQALKWVRVSVSDELRFDLKLKSELQIAQSKAQIDWAFSYVLSARPNYDNLAEAIRWANARGFTHVRVVANLLDLEHVKPRVVERVSTELAKRGVDDRLCIYQARQHWTIGTKDCFISLLKPLVGADGQLYACCGSQYSLGNQVRDYPTDMTMGAVENFPRIFETQMHFDGSRCKVCYYQHYNDCLRVLKSQVQHVKFV